MKKTLFAGKLALVVSAMWVGSRGSDPWPLAEILAYVLAVAAWRWSRVPLVGTRTQRRLERVERRRVGLVRAAVTVLIVAAMLHVPGQAPGLTAALLAYGLAEAFTDFIPAG